MRHEWTYNQFFAMQRFKNMSEVFKIFDSNIDIQERKEVYIIKYLLLIILQIAIKVLQNEHGALRSETEFENQFKSKY